MLDMQEALLSKYSNDTSQLLWLPKCSNDSTSLACKAFWSVNWLVDLPR